MPGSWIYDHVIPEYEALLFYNSLRRHHDGYSYHPVAMAKREEYGMKYRFLCIALPEANSMFSSHFADIEIYKPLKGMPYITSLYRLDFDRISSLRFPC